MSVRPSVCLPACLPACLVHAVRFALWQGPGRVPLSNLDRRQGPDDPQAGKQAEQFFGRLAAEAGRAGVAVDVVAVGQAAVNVPLLGPLAHKTGGLVSTHQRELCSPLPTLSQPAFTCSCDMPFPAVLFHSLPHTGLHPIVIRNPGRYCNTGGTSAERASSGTLMCYAPASALPAQRSRRGLCSTRQLYLPAVNAYWGLCPSTHGAIRAMLPGLTEEEKKEV